VLRPHYDRLQPVCPTCRASGRNAPRLQLATIVESEDDDIREGVLVCPEPACQREHPIVDGIPIVVADLQSWAAHQLDAVLWRNDLSPSMESLLGDAAGPGHALERERQTISAYGRAHWGDLDGDEPLPRESSIVTLLETALGLLETDQPNGVWIDLGCAVGRGTVELARRTGSLTVGVDLSFGMLRVAERARRESRAVFGVRRVGLVYDRREIALAEMPAADVSFWCCDVGSLPFADGTFAGALSLNVLDCVASPLQHLVEMGRVLASGAPALLSSPYDWSPTATPLAQWLGGHSQRGASHGSSAAELRRVLATVDTGLSLVEERQRVPWRVPVNERATMEYAVHLLHLRRGTP
jgi:SAM-dependent methyltransferase/uncharacterized protein YbaR (Trm112 family)